VRGNEPDESIIATSDEPLLPRRASQFHLTVNKMPLNFSIWRSVKVWLKVRMLCGSVANLRHIEETRRRIQFIIGKVSIYFFQIVTTLFLRLSCAEETKLPGLNSRNRTKIFLPIILICSLVMSISLLVMD